MLGAWDDFLVLLRSRYYNLQNCRFEATDYPASSAAFSCGGLQVAENRSICFGTAIASVTYGMQKGVVL
jgi:hypothetical protein